MANLEFTENAPEEPVAALHEVKEQEQPVYTYDPNTIRTLNAQQMDEIDARAWEEIDAGVDPEQVQAHIYDAMVALGFDLSEARENRLPVKLEGVDGKTDVRVINLASHDFGVPVRAARLVEAPQTPVERESTEESKEVVREISEFSTQFTELKSKLTGSLEQASALQLNTSRSLANIIEAGQMLIRKLEQRQEFKRDVMQIEDLISEARARVRTSEGASEAVNRDAQAAVGVVDRGVRLVAKGGGSADSISTTVRQARQGLEQLHSLQRTASQNSDGSMMALRRLDNLINEMNYSNHGMDAYANELRHVLMMVSETSQTSKRVQVNLTKAAEAFHAMA